jgi:DMSO/TMAO reductase YedYZ molybdopterin-dependent catalytic subunit
MDEMKLPPGQHAIEGFPRFGTHLSQPPPSVPDHPVIEVGGAVAEPFSFPLAELAKLPRRELTADFHCVAGWSATGLRWEGVAFATFYRSVVEPALLPGAAVTHLVFGGLDGFQSLLKIEDALGEDVLIAERLDGRPLDSDHGAPARLVSPKQYGYMNVKHLCQVEVHTSKPTEELGAASTLARYTLKGPLIMRHPRARVWEEERHPFLPARVLRPLYGALIQPFRILSRRGSRER